MQNSTAPLRGAGGGTSVPSSVCAYWTTPAKDLLQMHRSNAPPTQLSPPAHIAWEIEGSARVPREIAGTSLATSCYVHGFQMIECA